MSFIVTERVIPKHVLHFSWISFDNDIDLSQTHREQLWQYGGGGGPGLLGANPIALVVPQARLIPEQLLADVALPPRVLRVSHLVPFPDEFNQLRGVQNLY